MFPNIKYDHWCAKFGREGRTEIGAVSGCSVVVVVVVVIVLVLVVGV